MDDDLAFRESSGRTATLTHWSFGQLATIAGAPPNYLRSLPPSIASSAINYGLSRIERAQHQLFVADTAPWTVHAITSPRYARVHHDELASRGPLLLHGCHRERAVLPGQSDGPDGGDVVGPPGVEGDQRPLEGLVLVEHLAVYGVEPAAAGAGEAKQGGQQDQPEAWIPWPRPPTPWPPDPRVPWPLG